MGISREHLYKEVWAEPMTSVAKRYDVSSNYLARICERLNVPRPERGYWARRAGGIEDEVAALPAPDPGSDLEWVRDGSVPKRQPYAPRVVDARKSTRKRADLHPLLAGARAHFDHARESSHETYVRPYKHKLVDVLVSKNQLERALKAAGALFFILEDGGCDVALLTQDADCHRLAPELREEYKGKADYYRDFGRWNPSHATVCMVGGIPIGITIFEMSEEVETRYDSVVGGYVRVATPKATAKKATGSRLGYAEWTTKSWLPSGRLGLHAYSPPTQHPMGALLARVKDR